jgi:imidazolonepropionase-like amidohydrolase
VRPVQVFVSMIAITVGLASVSATQAGQTGGATLFEGARLIAGDGRAPIDNSAFLVAGDRITSVGRKGEVTAPSGTMRVDLTGKTVMPALIDIHNHLGWTNLKTNQATKTSLRGSLSSIT